MSEQQPEPAKEKDAPTANEKVKLKSFLADNSHLLTMLFALFGTISFTSSISFPFLRVGLTFTMFYMIAHVFGALWKEFPPKSQSESHLYGFRKGLAVTVSVAVYFIFFKQWDIAKGDFPQPMILSAMFAAAIWMSVHEMLSDAKQERVRVWLTEPSKKRVRTPIAFATILLSMILVYFVISLISPVIDVVARLTRMQ
jgi:hypothetical protein